MLKSQAFWVGIAVGVVLFYVYKNYMGRKGA